MLLRLVRDSCDTIHASTRKQSHWSRRKCARSATITAEHPVQREVIGGSDSRRSHMFAAKPLTSFTVFAGFAVKFSAIIIAECKKLSAIAGLMFAAKPLTSCSWTASRGSAVVFSTVSSCKRSMSEAGLCVCIAAIIVPVVLQYEVAVRAGFDASCAVVTPIAVLFVTDIISASAVRATNASATAQVHININVLRIA